MTKKLMNHFLKNEPICEWENCHDRNVSFSDTPLKWIFKSIIVREKCNNFPYGLVCSSANLCLCFRKQEFRWFIYVENVNYWFFKTNIFDTSKQYCFFWFFCFVAFWYFISFCFQFMLVISSWVNSSFCFVKRFYIKLRTLFFLKNDLFVMVSMATVFLLDYIMCF